MAIFPGRASDARTGFVVGLVIAVTLLDYFSSVAKRLLILIVHYFYVMGGSMFDLHQEQVFWHPDD